MAGAWVSFINMVCTHVLEFPQWSVAVQVLVIVYSAGHPPPPPTETSENVTIGAPSHPSTAVALPVLAGKVFSPHCIVMFAGHVITGARLSSSTIV
jgi:hypothetical protein